VADSDTAVPTRKPTPNVFTVLLVVSSLLMVAGVVWVSLRNVDQAGGPFEYRAK
jgi:uncharacterized membrane protein (UPF0136 family)